MVVYSINFDEAKELIPDGILDEGVRCSVRLVRQKRRCAVPCPSYACALTDSSSLVVESQKKGFTPRLLPTRIRKLLWGAHQENIHISLQNEDVMFAMRGASAVPSLKSIANSQGDCFFNIISLFSESSLSLFICSSHQSDVVCVDCVDC